MKPEFCTKEILGLNWVWDTNIAGAFGISELSGNNKCNNIKLAKDGKAACVDAGHIWIGQTFKEHRSVGRANCEAEAAGPASAAAGVPTGSWIARYHTCRATMDHFSVDNKDWGKGHILNGLDIWSKRPPLPANEGGGLEDGVLDDFDDCRILVREKGEESKTGWETEPKEMVGQTNGCHSAVASQINCEGRGPCVNLGFDTKDKCKTRWGYQWNTKIERCVHIFLSDIYGTGNNWWGTGGREVCENNNLHWMSVDAGSGQDGDANNGYDHEQPGIYRKVGKKIFHGYYQQGDTWPLSGFGFGFCQERFLGCLLGFKRFER